MIEADLEDLGRYYRCYLALMDHWNSVLPGKVLHVQYEALVKDPDGTIRRLLRHLGEPTEPPAREPARGPPFWKSRVLRRAAHHDELFA